MLGTIQSKQRCPVCGGSFPSSRGEVPIECPNCPGVRPTRYRISLWVEGQTRKLYRDRSGQPLTSWELARETLTEARARTRAGSFDYRDYTQAAMTLSRYWETYFLRRYRDGSSTKDKLVSIGRHQFAPLMDRNIRDIKGAHITEWWLDLADRGLSPKFRNDCLSWLKRVFKSAYLDEVIPTEPRFNVRPAKNPKKRIEYLEREDQLRVLLATPSFDQPIYSFLMFAGCRVMEAAALHWEDVDFKREEIAIRRSLDRHGKLGPPKDQDARLLPLIGRLKALLESLRRLPVVSITGFVFLNRWGRHYSYEYLRSTWRDSCKRAGVPLIQLKNATRHSWAMQRIGRESDKWLVAQALGHSDLKTTSAYLEAQPEHLRVLFE